MHLPKLIGALLLAVLVNLSASVSAQIDAPAPRSFIEPVTGLRFVLIPAGSFTMGSNFAETQHTADQRWFVDEAPPHTVTISRSFWLASTETTIAAFSQFVEETGYITTAERIGQSLGAYVISSDSGGLKSGQWGQGAHLSWRNQGWKGTNNYPVTHVSWVDATAFTQWLSDKTGRSFRLPTEAEWEYAAGGPLHTLYSWGNDEPTTGKEGNIADSTFSVFYQQWKYPVLASLNDGYIHPAPVGSYVANGFGLFDMTGNVWEWCADHYVSDFYMIGPAIDPLAKSGTDRVHRGGGSIGS